MPEHHIVVTTHNPHAPRMLAATLGHVQSVGWDVDPLTNRQYPARVEAFIYYPAEGRAEAVEAVRPTYQMPEDFQRRLDALVARLEYVAADLWQRAPERGDLDEIKSVAASLREMRATTIVGSPLAEVA